MLSCFSHVQLFATLWTVASDSSIHWDSPDENIGVGYHALLQGNLPDPGIKTVSFVAGGSFTTSTTVEVPIYFILCIILQHYFLIQIFLDLARGVAFLIASF